MWREFEDPGGQDSPFLEDGVRLAVVAPRGMLRGESDVQPVHAAEEAVPEQLHPLGTNLSLGVPALLHVQEVPPSAGGAGEDGQGRAALCQWRGVQLDLDPLDSCHV